MKKIDLNDIEYLTFEGGGGKGIIYLGAIKALEESLGVERLIDVLSDLDDDVRRPIKGISGASAGAITAFMLSLGLSGEEIDNEIKTVVNKNYQTSLNDKYALVIDNGDRLLPISGVNAAETFLDPPNGFYRSVERGQRVFPYDTLAGINLENFGANILKSFLEEEVINDPLIQRLFYRTGNKIKDAQMAGNYIHNFLYHRGLFSGFEIRFFFQSMMKKYLIDKYSEEFKRDYNYTFPKPENITFYDFYKFTGVDLIISGTNISQQRPLFFSAYHTPDFPVTEAVAISMNIPIVFKPIYVDYDVDRNRDREYNLFYKGLWGDGGMLNNFPIHAFDELKRKRMEFKGQQVVRELGGTLYNSDVDFNQKTLGLLLGDKISNLKPTDREKSEEFPKRNIGVLGDYFADLFRTFMFSGSKGRIRNAVEDSFTIELDSEKVGMLDFSHPDMDKMRADFMKETINILRDNEKKQIARKIENEFRVRQKNKLDAISDAYLLVSSIVN